MVSGYILLEPGLASLNGLLFAARNGSRSRPRDRHHSSIHEQDEIAGTCNGLFGGMRGESLNRPTSAAAETKPR
jgi:hypothetical protein